MANVAIITARGGSKRIPRKYIKDFLGKPIIAYSIEAAIKSKLFDEVMVSTDDDEIAEISKKYGAKVPFMRSQKNADDYSTTIDVIYEVLNSYREIGVNFNFACCLYPTAPLIQIENLIEGFLKIEQEKRAIVYPVVSFSYPVWRGLTIESDGNTKMLWPEYENTRSQDLIPVYHDAGQWYWFDVEKINDLSATGSVIISEELVQDIDTLSDWKMAEMKYKLFNQPSIS